MSVHVIVDVSNLAYRNFYAMGDLSFDGVTTGVLFGIFRDIMGLRELFDPDTFSFCFDRGRPLRCRKDPRYKSDRGKKRKKRTEEERIVYDELFRQIRRLHRHHLPAMGFQNVFAREGYEADDLIASLCLDSLPPGGEAVIVSTDQDLFQLLEGGRVSIWNPMKKKSITAGWFDREYGIAASMWADVKALAGCPGDCVKGIDGVGEKTAIKFLTGNLKTSSKAYDRIIDGRETWDLNLELVRLPYEGTPKLRIVPDDTSQGRWDRVVNRLGMKTLRGRGSGVKKGDCYV